MPGVAPANAVILGGGVVGTNAAKMALGLGAHVTIIDRNLNRLRELDDIFNSQVVTLASNALTIRENLESPRDGQNICGRSQALSHIHLRCNPECRSKWSWS